LCASQVSSSLDFGRGPGSLPCPGSSSTHRPPHRAMWVHSTLDQIPSRVLRPPLDRPARRPDPSPLRFLRPSTASTSEPFFVGRAVQPRPGSALRLSQPLSGFGLLEFHGLVSCRNRSWASSLQSLPLTEIVYPSRGH